MIAVQDIHRAARHLQDGGLVAFPTETVYGLGADARSPAAVAKVFAAKGRPADHPLIVHIASVEALSDWAQVPPQHVDNLQRLSIHWPGPLTVILPRHPDVPDAVTGGRDTVGLRIPAHPVAQALLRAFGGGLAAPSANRFGHVSPTTAAHVRAELGDRALVLDGGPTTVGVESTIVDLTGPRAAVLRPGGVPTETIAALVGPLMERHTAAPGTLPAHYAPSARLRICPASHSDAEATRLRAQGLTVAIVRTSEPADHARRLYAELRSADNSGADVILAEPAQESGLGRAINDRLRRAEVGSTPHTEGAAP